MKRPVIKKTIRFNLSTTAQALLHEKEYGFGFEESGFGRAVFYRSYARKKEDGTRESWPEAVIRVINGVFTIRKWWAKEHHLTWDENEMQELAKEMAIAMLEMKWLPPGRGIANMGTDFVYDRGSMGLYNCAAIEINDLAEDCGWLMEALMYGTGVGFAAGKTPQLLLNPIISRTPKTHIIEDSREGWVESIKIILKAYTEGSEMCVFDYSQIRPEGAELKSFGGTASGPDPLIVLHKRLKEYCDKYIENRKEYSWTRLVADICNAIGVAVIAGSTRRSAEIAIGDMDDIDFMELKNYNKHPERASVGWMSNNSVRLWKKEDFLNIHKLVPSICKNGEPGILNMINIQKYGRFGEEKPDDAEGANPCSEICLVIKIPEVCNIAEIFPIYCNSKAEFLQQCKHATFYCSTVSLLPTHSTRTNLIVGKNRRIGVSLSGIAQWVETWGMAQCIRWMRDGYKTIKELNELYNKQAGVPSSIRLTTVKPSGSISQLAGVSSGMHWPTFRYAIRRMLVHKSNPLSDVLIKANYKYEPLLEILTEKEAEGKEKYKKYKDFAGGGMVAVKSEVSNIFEFPIFLGKARAASGVSAWEQFSMLATLQREWADNSVSCTINFAKHEESQLPYMLSQFAPVIKSVSLLPTGTNSYPQMPYEQITKPEYDEKISKIKKVDWGSIKGDGAPDQTSTLYCENDKCEMR